MKKIVYLALIAGIIMNFSSCNMGKRKTAPEIPLEDFFKNPEKTSYKISPNGEFYSFLGPYNDRLNVFVQKVDDDSATQITFVEDRDIKGYLWANNERILYLRDVGGDENYKLFGVNIDGTDLKGLTDFEGVKTLIIDELENIEDEIIIAMNKRDARVFDPYRLNIVSGEMEMLAENNGFIVDWLTDHEGKLRVAVEAIMTDVSLLYREKEEDEFKKVITTDWKEEINPLFFDFENEHVFALSNYNRDKLAVVKFDIKNGNELEVVLENDEVDIMSMEYSKKKKALTH
ncbi:S9 family peptidase, partial [Bacteroidota bacterium]